MASMDADDGACESPAKVSLDASLLGLGERLRTACATLVHAFGLAGDRSPPYATILTSMASDHVPGPDVREAVDCVRECFASMQGWDPGSDWAACVLLADPPVSLLPPWWQQHPNPASAHRSGDMADVILPCVPVDLVRRSVLALMTHGRKGNHDELICRCLCLLHDRGHLVPPGASSLCNVSNWPLAQVAQQYDAAHAGMRRLCILALGALQSLDVCKGRRPLGLMPFVWNALLDVSPSVQDGARAALVDYGVALVRGVHGAAIIRILRHLLLWSPKHDDHPPVHAHAAGCDTHDDGDGEGNDSSDGDDSEDEVVTCNLRRWQCVVEAGVQHVFHVLATSNNVADLQMSPTQSLGLVPGTMASLGNSPIVSLSSQPIAPSGATVTSDVDRRLTGLVEWKHLLLTSTTPMDHAAFYLCVYPPRMPLPHFGQHQAHPFTHCGVKDRETEQRRAHALWMQWLRLTSEPNDPVAHTLRAWDAHVSVQQDKAASRREAAVASPSPSKFAFWSPARGQQRKRSTAAEADASPARSIASAPSDYSSSSDGEATPGHRRSFDASNPGAPSGGETQWGSRRGSVGTSGSTEAFELREPTPPVCVVGDTVCDKWRECVDWALDLSTTALQCMADAWVGSVHGTLRLLSSTLLHHAAFHTDPELSRLPTTSRRALAHLLRHGHVEEPAWQHLVLSLLVEACLAWPQASLFVNTLMQQLVDPAWHVWSACMAVHAVTRNATVRAVMTDAHALQVALRHMQHTLACEGALDADRVCILLQAVRGVRPSPTCLTSLASLLPALLNPALQVNDAVAALMYARVFQLVSHCLVAYETDAAVREVKRSRRNGSHEMQDVEGEGEGEEGHNVDDSDDDDDDDKEEDDEDAEGDGHCHSGVCALAMSLAVCVSGNECLLRVPAFGRIVTYLVLQHHPVCTACTQTYGKLWARLVCHGLGTPLRKRAPWERLTLHPLAVQPLTWVTRLCHSMPKGRQWLRRQLCGRGSGCTTTTSSGGSNGGDGPGVAARCVALLCILCQPRGYAVTALAQRLTAPRLGVEDEGEGGSAVAPGARTDGGGSNHASPTSSSGSGEWAILCSAVLTLTAGAPGVERTVAPKHYVGPPTPAATAPAEDTAVAVCHDGVTLRALLRTACRATTSNLLRQSCVAAALRLAAFDATHASRVATSLVFAWLSRLGGPEASRPHRPTCWRVARLLQCLPEPTGEVGAWIGAQLPPPKNVHQGDELVQLLNFVGYWWAGLRLKPEDAGAAAMCGMADRLCHCVSHQWSEDPALVTPALHALAAAPSWMNHGSEGVLVRPKHDGSSASHTNSSGELPLWGDESPAPVESPIQRLCRELVPKVLKSVDVTPVPLTLALLDVSNKHDCFDTAHNGALMRLFGNTDPVVQSQLTEFLVNRPEFAPRIPSLIEHFTRESAVRERATSDRRLGALLEKLGRFAYRNWSTADVRPDAWRGLLPMLRHPYRPVVVYALHTLALDAHLECIPALPAVVSNRSVQVQDGLCKLIGRLVQTFGRQTVLDHMQAVAPEEHAIWRFEAFWAWVGQFE